MLVANVLEEGVYGGPQKRVVLIADSLLTKSAGLDQRIRSIIIGPSDADRLIDECAQRSIDYIPLKLTPLSRQPKTVVKYLLNFFKEIRELKQVIVSQQPDLVHCSGGSWSVKACVAAKLAQTPFIWHMNDTSQPKLILTLFRILVRKLKPSGVLYSGNKAKEYYKQYFAQTIPWTISRPPIENSIRDIQISNVERPANLGNASCNIVLIGNINPTKGSDLAVQAAVQLINEGKDISLTLAGAVKSTQKDYFDLVKKHAGSEMGSRINYIGSVKNVAPYLLHSDIALCTSLSEAGPMSAWEAAAARCALVSADVGDVAEVLGQDGTFLFEPGDLDGLIEKLRLAVDDRDLRNDRARVAYERSAKLLVHESAKTTGTLYQQVLEAVSSEP